MNALRTSDNDILDAYLWGNNAINTSSEKNYQHLLELVEDIDKPNAYAVGGKSNADGLIDLGVDVLTRDARLRANRIALSHFYRHSQVDMVATSLMDIQLYHDFGIAVSLGCEDSTGYRRAGRTRATAGRSIGGAQSTPRTMARRSAGTGAADHTLRSGDVSVLSCAANAGRSPRKFPGISGRPLGSYISHILQCDLNHINGTTEMPSGSQLEPCVWYMV